MHSPMQVTGSCSIKCAACTHLLPSLYTCLRYPTRDTEMSSMTRGHWTLGLPLLPVHSALLTHPYHATFAVPECKAEREKLTKRECKAYRIANLRGRTATMGKRKKQMTKHAAAPRLQPEKMRMRSQRDTVGLIISRVVRAG